MFLEQTLREKYLLQERFALELLVVRLEFDAKLGGLIFPSRVVGEDLVVHVDNGVQNELAERAGGAIDLGLGPRLLGRVEEVVAPESRKHLLHGHTWVDFRVRRVGIVCMLSS